MDIILFASCFTPLASKSEYVFLDNVHAFAGDFKNLVFVKN